MTPNPLKLCVVNGKPALDARFMSMASAPCQVWLFGFTDDVHMQEGLAALLARDEHERARAFVVPSARNRYVQTRAVLRLLLGHRLGQAPEALSFEYGPYGKPALRNGGQWRFNVAHSGDYALLAIADGMQVGVDIECQRDSADLDSLARMVLAPSEALAWALLPEEDRVAAFFSVWTAKEAVVKAIGRGLGLGLAVLDLGGLPLDAREGGMHVAVGESGSCRLTPLAAPAGYAAALALHEIV